MLLHEEIQSKISCFSPGMIERAANSRRYGAFLRVIIITWGILNVDIDYKMCELFDARLMAYLC